MDAITWSIISAMFCAIGALILILFKRLKSELDAVIANQGALSKVAEAFTAFRAMDTEREKHWTTWRVDYERRMHEYMNGQALWRHQELGPALKRIEDSLGAFRSDLSTIKETVRHLEQRST